MTTSFSTTNSWTLIPPHTSKCLFSSVIWFYPLFSIELEQKSSVQTVYETVSGIPVANKPVLMPALVKPIIAFPDDPGLGRSVGYGGQPSNFGLLASTSKSLSDSHPHFPLAQFWIFT